MDAIVFLVDAFDTQRFPESKTELCSLLADEQLGHCPILILGNKIDRSGAASEDQLRSYFELHNTTGKVQSFVLLLIFALNLTILPEFCYRGKLHDQNYLRGRWNCLCAQFSNVKATGKVSAG